MDGYLCTEGIRFVGRAFPRALLRPFHDLRHASLTHVAAASNPQIYLQARAGHSQGSITDRYMHAAQVLFPGAAEKSEARMFGEPPAVDVPPSGS